MLSWLLWQLDCNADDEILNYKFVKHQNLVQRSGVVLIDMCICYMQSPNLHTKLLKVSEKDTQSDMHCACSLSP